MKKIFLTTMALLTIASASVFGMYGVDTDWINFLTHGNQFRARLDQLGFTLGNDTIKGTFGFDNNMGFGGLYGSLLRENQNNSDYYDWLPSISMGIGYTSSIIGIGVGYSATVGDVVQRFKGKDESKAVNKSAHTPVLVLNAMDNAFRMAIPIQVYVDNEKYSEAMGGGKSSDMAVSVDSQFRYYTGLDVLPQVRLYLRYGLYQNEQKADKDAEKVKTKYAESFGFDLRFYFGSMVEEVALQPLVKLVYNGALGNYHGTTRVEAVKVMKGEYTDYGTGSGLGVWDLNLMLGLGLTANSDIVSLYLEPSLGLKVNRAVPTTGSSTTPGGAPEAAANLSHTSYSLGYDVYAEIYITPIKNLEWYFELGLNNIQANYLTFAGTTGITWYLPAL